MDSTTSYEIQAEAFRIMTGHQAPGKDVSPHAYTISYEERVVIFERWIKDNGACVNAMLKAFESVSEN